MDDGQKVEIDQKHFQKKNVLEVPYEQLTATAWEVYLSYRGAKNWAIFFTAGRQGIKDEPCNARWGFFLLSRQT